MDSSKPAAQFSSTLLPGFLIGGGVSLLIVGLDFLRFLLGTRADEDAPGVPGSGAWAGVGCVGLGLIFLVVGWRWLGRLAARDPGRETLMNAMLGVLVLFLCTLLPRARWFEMASLALSLVVVMIVGLRTKRSDLS